MPAADPINEDQPECAGSDDPDPSPSLDHGSQAGDRFVVDCINHTDEDLNAAEGWLVSQMRRAVRLAGARRCSLTLAIVDDDEMADHHEQYTGVSGTTDVLTFDLKESDGLNPCRDDDIEGDIVVCIDEARRQAGKRDHPVEHELLLYAVHGMLHLLGEDDHDSDDYARMHAREDELLEQLGVGRLFNPDTQPPEPKA